MTMLEKAARAAQEIQVGVGEDGEAVFPGPHVGLALTRAVLMAVREPDDAMQLAGYEYAPNQREQFTAMIDAILDGK